MSVLNELVKEKKEKIFLFSTDKNGHPVLVHVNPCYAIRSSNSTDEEEETVHSTPTVRDTINTMAIASSPFKMIKYVHASNRCYCSVSRKRNLLENPTTTMNII